MKTFPEHPSFDTLMQQSVGTVFPAAVLYILQQGDIRFQRAYGFLDPEHSRHPTRVDTLFDLASLTKILTAINFMILVDTGVITLDTVVKEVLPKFDQNDRIGPSQDPLTRKMLPPEPAFAGQRVDVASITFRHLLTHTSGLAAWRSLFHEGDETTPVPRPEQVTLEQRARRIEAIYRSGFAYPPGQRLVYSDLGFILLGEAIACLRQKTLAEALQESLLRPLALSHTHYNPLSYGYSLRDIAPTEFCSWRRRRCWGEVHDENAASLGGVAGHAGLFAPAEEVARLGQLFLQQGQWQGKNILSSSSVQEMTREQVARDGVRRGLGWLLQAVGTSPVGPAPGPHSYGHTGFTGTSLWVDPDRELVIVVLSNRVYYGRDAARIVRFRHQLHQSIYTTLDS
ncbi:MAG: serine hydrolase [Chloroflexi bacterium]|nr:serine hydrolase [Chloroflexota bacterium]